MSSQRINLRKNFNSMDKSDFLEFEILNDQHQHFLILQPCLTYVFEFIHALFSFHFHSYSNMVRAMLNHSIPLYAVSDSLLLERKFKSLSSDFRFMFKILPAWRWNWSHLLEITCASSSCLLSSAWKRCLLNLNSQKRVFSIFRKPSAFWIFFCWKILQWNFGRNSKDPWNCVKNFSEENWAFKKCSESFLWQWALALSIQS